MSTYVEPKRPKPWGTILDPQVTPPQPSEPPMPTLKDRATFFAEFRELDAFYAAQDGLQRTGGMLFPVDGGNPIAHTDTEAMASWGYDLMLGATVAACKARIRQSDEWRSKHPGAPPPVTPPSALVPLHIEGTTFRRHDGTIWKYRAVTAFSAFQDFLAGRDLAPYAAWTRSVGGNAWRVFYTWNVTGFDPRVIGWATFRDGLEEFRTWMDAQGLYSHNTILCDQVPNSVVLLNATDQRALVDIVVGVMQGRHVELMNEAWKNGGNALCASVAPERFHGTFASRSTWQDGEVPTVCGSLLDFTSEHTPRDGEWPRKAKNLLETSVQGIQGLVSGKPAIGGEPIGIFEQDIPGSRTANASDVADYYAVAELFGAGACLHGDGTTLQRCNVPGPNAQRCAEWAKAAREAIPAEAQLGSYTRGGLDSCPIEHDDALALRTFFMLQGNRGTGVVVRPQPGWSPQTRNGWHLERVAGPNGHIITVTR